MNTRSIFFAGAVAALIACGGSEFDPQNMVQGVRILSARADKPYAKPGERVQLDMLVADGRKDTTRPLKVLWFPFVCTNPRADAYFNCFAPTRGAGGATTSPLGALPRGVDLATLLPNGTSYSFTMPEDVLRAKPGSADPYGTAFVFNIACAGRLLVKDFDTSLGPQAVPLACVDEAGTPLGPDDYVIGFTRVFAYENRKNANPIIDHLVFNGATVDVSQGVTVAPCSAGDAEDCPEQKVDVVMKAGSQELNSNEKAADGIPLKEVVWATYYTSAGRFDSDARLLFDAREGEVTSRENKYRAKSDAKSGSMWVVVKDNRGGTDWFTIPLNVR